MQRRSQGDKSMEAKNKGFERLKRIIASKEPEEDEPPDEARRKVDDCLFGENSYNEIFYKTLLSMRGELMDYLDSNPEDDSLTATIRSAIVGVTQAEEVYEMMVEMNRIGFEDSDCEDREEDPSTCVDSKDPGTNEEPAEAEKLLPAFSITDEEVIDYNLKPEADEAIDDMDLALHGANKLREYIAKLYPDENVLTKEYIDSGSMEDEVTEELKDDRGVIPEDVELTSEIPISGATNQDGHLISECNEEPIIEGRIFDIGKDTRPMEANGEASLKVPPVPLHVVTQVSSENLHGKEEGYNSKPIKSGKDPGKLTDLVQDSIQETNRDSSGKQEVECKLEIVDNRNVDKLNFSESGLSRDDKSVPDEALMESREISADVSLPKAEISLEGIPINSGKDPGEPLGSPQGCDKEVKSDCSLAREIEEATQETERPDIADWESLLTPEPASTNHPIRTEESTADLYTLPKTGATHTSVPIKPGKDPGVRYDTEGKFKTEILGSKSGGKPLVANKQLKPGWDPPVNES